MAVEPGLEPRAKRAVEHPELLDDVLAVRTGAREGNHALHAQLPPWDALAVVEHESLRLIDRLAHAPQARAVHRERPLLLAAAEEPVVVGEGGLDGVSGDLLAHLRQAERRERREQPRRTVSRPALKVVES